MLKQHSEQLAELERKSQLLKQQHFEQLAELERNIQLLKQRSSHILDEEPAVDEEEEANQQRYRQDTIKDLRYTVEHSDHPIFKAIAQHDLDVMLAKGRRNKASELVFSPEKNQATITFYLGNQQIVDGVTLDHWAAIEPSSSHGDGWVDRDPLRKEFVAECGFYWQ